jgi:hypothetical protein
MNGWGLVAGILGVWRITHLFAAEDGPWDVVVRLRQVAGSGFWGDLLDCFYCLSIWVAVPLALVLGPNWTGSLFLWPALSGGAILIERVTAARAGEPEASTPREKEAVSGMLREEEREPEAPNGRASGKDGT